MLRISERESQHQGGSTSPKAMPIPAEGAGQQSGGKPDSIPTRPEVAFHLQL
jgi:hypothetical protein